MRLRPHRIDVDELMDDEGADPASVAGALDDLSRLNRFLGGADLTLRAVDRALALQPAGRALRVLDVATGAADIPRALLRHADQHGVEVEVTALDANATILQEAARRTDGPVDFVQGDALAMPFEDGQFDIVLCSLMLHHFPPPLALRVLAEMRRVSSHAVIVNDLVRAWHPWLFARVVGPLVTRNALTRFDGPASVLCAYTPDELLRLVEAAGLTPRWRAGLLGYRTAVLATLRLPEEGL